LSSLQQSRDSRPGLRLESPFWDLRLACIDLRLDVRLDVEVMRLDLGVGDLQLAHVLTLHSQFEGAPLRKCVEIMLRGHLSSSNNNILSHH